ncbi:hypothetical protein LDL_004 [Lactobacillus phage Ldl1]|uniref:Uncharacterized protein n=1 Tax=Lactobacillus phage Ldl1 TaxID=1552735 RepID=A0A0A7DMJ9_9CAUD|nr:hypothetical protein VC66_gp04 [Lactobacillus phage Ldl1]AIS73862.1 hypothetical protein LDL_004 [Lactobacillus phage Ldl1]
MSNLEIVKVFEETIKDQTEGYDLREYLEDTLKYGQTAFTYYRETSELYDRYRSDCDAWLEDLVSERGLNPWEIFPEWDYAPNSEKNAWVVVVAMFEEYCRYLLEDYGQE